MAALPRPRTAAAARRPEQPLVPPPLRAAVLILALLGTAVLLLLAVRYHGGRHPGGLDDRIYRHLPAALHAHQRALGTIAGTVPIAVAVISAAVAVHAAVRRHWNVALLALVGPGLTVLLVEVAKPVVDRTLRGGLALPSGHTAGATSMLLVLGLLVLRRVRRRVRPAAGAVLAVVTAGAAAVGLTMVEIGAHYPTDAVAGYATALAVTLAAALVVDASID